MRWRSRWIVAGLLVGAWPGLAAGAAQPGVGALAGRPIVSVRVIAGGQEVADPSVLALLDTRPGVALDMQDVRRTLRSLVALDRFEDITVEAFPHPAGLEIVYRVAPVRRIEGIAFRGDLGWRPRKLRGVLRERFGASVESAQRSRDMADHVAYTLREAGFLDATASARVEPRPDGESAMLVFDVAAGARYRVAASTVTGEPLDGEARLVGRLGIAPGAAWNEAESHKRAEREARRWRDRGYYQARIDLIARRREAMGLVDVEVAARPGPLVELAFEGDALPRGKVDDLVPVKRDGSADEDLLEDSKRRVEQLLHAEGYWKASVEYRREQQPGRLRIVFDVRRGRAYEVSDLEIIGAQSLPVAEIESLLTLRTGRPFVEATLESDATAVLRHYQVRGYASARVDTQVSETAAGTAAPSGVVARIVISEGNRTSIGRIGFAGNRRLDEPDLRARMRLKEGGPFFSPWLAADRAAIEAAYLDRGYADVIVGTDTSEAATGGSIDLGVRITEGERAIVQHVIVTGNERTATDTILRELRLVPGQPLGLQDLADAQRRLTALGLFRRVRLEAVRDPEGGHRDVVVSVEENAATTVGYGGGIEGGRQLRREDPTGNAVEQFEFAPRGFFEVGRRNLWGKNRSVNFFSRASLRRKPGTTDDPDPGGYGIYEYRVIGALREPRAFGWNADATVSGLFEQAIRSSFSYRRRAANADLTRRLTRNLTAGVRYSYGYTNVYEERYDPADQPLIDRLFPQVTLSVVSGIGAWDTRDDVIDPTRGHLIGVQADLAARALGSEVGYVKSFGQAFIYRKLPGSRLVFAGGARLGLAMGFAQQVPVLDDDGDPVLDENGSPMVETVKDLPASERFYAGGDTTVRGFTLDRLGDEETIDPDGFPKGGDAVVILNGELRFPVTQTIGGVVFLDAGNVFARVSQLDLGRIRGAAGFGVRYRSPIGPLRVDLGFKLDPQTLGNGSRERGYAVHISVGQAF
jgi:outer membrane protein insertion porin family